MRSYLRRVLGGFLWLHDLAKLSKFVCRKTRLSHCSYDETSKLLRRLRGVDLSDKQIKRICHYHRQLLDRKLYIDAVEGADQTCYDVEMDGSMVLTRP